MTGEDTRNARAGPSQPKKRKAGGEGKKGKVFLENKNDLLSLISNVTDSKESIVKSRLDKQKASLSEHPPKPEGTASASSKKVKVKERRGVGQEKKSAKRERALEEAKEKILQRQKEKKARVKQRSSGSGAAATGSGAKAGVVLEVGDQPKKKKKSVGFA